ncbi:MAG TPA: rhomboid family intramembrane serine protease [Terriglobales bacterium]|nr:rhomboid family intramembrane serine protease [Terriglobales bacterium]
MARFAKEGGNTNPLPRLDDPDAKPQVTIGLMALNIIVYVAVVFSGASPLEPDTQTLFRFGGTHGIYSLFIQQWRLLSANFVHAGILHIGMNMMGLWYLGELVESIFDRWVYILLYAVCGVAGMMAASWWNPMTVTVGASGAIFGLGGALISALYLGNLPLVRQSAQSTLRILLIVTGFDLIYGFTSPNISNSAHLGGLAAGLALGAILAPSLTARPGRRQLWSAAVFACVGMLLGAAAIYAQHIFQRLAG